jgi:protein-S-isoprenylcysteine O-methyltransferase Ste14
MAAGRRITMHCRSCGTDIAEKALICYKCGTATTEAKYQPAVIPRGGRSRLGLVVFVVLLALLAALAVFTGRSSDAAVSRFFPWAAVTLAVAIVALRAWARRR